MISNPSNKEMVAKIVAQFRWAYCPVIGVDDLRQEAWIALMVAEKFFDPRKSQWDSFASFCARRRIRRFIERNSKLKYEATAADEPRTNSEVNQVDNRTDARFLVSRLRHKDRALINDWVFGYQTMQQIADRLRVSKQAIHQRVKQAIGEMRQWT